MTTVAVTASYPTSLGTSLVRPPVAVNSPPAPNAGVTDVAATGGTTHAALLVHPDGSAMTTLIQPVSPAHQRETNNEPDTAA